MRLRRELAWAWAARSGGLSAADALGRALDQQRLHAARQRFFEHDDTARFLTQCLREELPASVPGARGSFSWIARELELDEAACFVLGLALLAVADGGAGPVIAACADGEAGDLPSLALAQRLWDAPGAVTPLLHDDHPLCRFAILHREQGRSSDPWRRGLHTPASLVATLCDGDIACSAAPVKSVEVPSLAPALYAPGLEGRLSQPNLGFRVVRVRGAADCGARAAVARYTAALGRRLVRPTAAFSAPAALRVASTHAWLAGADLIVHADELGFAADAFVALDLGAPIVVWWVVPDDGPSPKLPAAQLLAEVRVTPLCFDERLEHWKTGLGDAAPPSLADVARRFRFGPDTIAHLAASARARSADLIDMCRAELSFEFGAFAEPVRPRFEPEELILSAPARRVFDEILDAMRSLTEVHYGWGTARAWNEAGIAVLFAGPAGTGKTMAAECLAAALRLPMFRVDVSQLVSKYVGETEKNLKRVFDAAECGDALLFLDEAEALFGTRVEQRSAQDRFVNLEVGYLLGRMERAKGLIVLATNRKADFDSAFLRRLRYVLEFEAPGADERRRIWQLTLPSGVDCHHIDVDFLGQRFQLTGGQIRSIVFNACLHAAAHQGRDERSLSMEAVIVALKRELDKQPGGGGLEQFGPYARLVRNMEGPHA